MDRFEEIQRLYCLLHSLDLHSSMDRFEAFVAVYKFSVSIIYIPVWIDLKWGLFNNSNA